MIKKIVASLLAVAMAAAMSVTVLAEDNSNAENDGRRMGTQEDWAELRREYERGERVVVPLSGEKAGAARAFGAYPKVKGTILVTDQYFAWQEGKSWTGHAGIVRSELETTEAFPFQSTYTVDTHSNNWDSRYGNRDVYGLDVTRATLSQQYAAAEWCANKKSSGLCYKINANTTDSTEVNCASLVYHGFMNASGISVTQGTPLVTPMDLVQSPNTATIYTNF